MEEEVHRYTLMDEIVYHRKDETTVTKEEGCTDDSNGRSQRNITTKRWSFLVNWKDRKNIVSH